MEEEIQHINATAADFTGNAGIGRYVLLVGSDQRAKAISLRFDNLVVKEHPRQNNLYLGTISPSHDFKIDMAVISTGMGCPSLDIILNELILLGARRFLRIGTAGSLQAEQVKAGDLVIATAAVRDESTSDNYIYREFPAVASWEAVLAAQRAVHKLTLNDHSHAGIVHTKSSLYAREMQYSSLDENKTYIRNLSAAGVLATEMECAHLFILSELLSYNPKIKTRIIAGAVLAIIGDKTPFHEDKDLIELAIMRSIDVGINTIVEMALLDKKTADPF